MKTTPIDVFEEKKVLGNKKHIELICKPSAKSELLKG